MRSIDTTITYDAEADAAYVYVTNVGKGEVADSIPIEDEDEDFPGGELIVDLDKDGRVLGIEVLGASRMLPTKLLDRLG
jgi:uncharacterized protein YuzE